MVRNHFVPFFMVAIISSKLVVKSMVFNSTHGFPTQGTISCENFVELYFRFRSHEFKVCAVEGLSIIFDNTLYVNYYFNRDNVDKEFIMHETSGFLDWSNIPI